MALPSKPFKVKLKIYQGATFRWHATLKSGTPEAVVDLTGYTARLHVRLKIEDAEPVLTLTTENGGITLGDADGTIDLFISDADTADITWEEAVYDLELIAPNTDVIRFMGGAVTVSPEVTR